MVDENKNPWTINKSEKVYENPWIAVEHNEVTTPTGSQGVYGIVSFKHKAVGILTLDHELNTFLVGQYRLPLKKYSWEIPEGGCEKGENALDSAKRELSEECGVQANKWTEIQQFALSNSVSDETGTIFLAQDLQLSVAHPDDNEELVCKKIPFAKALEMVMAGEITDSISIMAILKVEYLLNNQLI